MKVFLYQWLDNPMSRHTAKCLAYSFGQWGTHELVSVIDQADVIYACEANEDPYGMKLRRLLKQYGSHIPVVVVSVKDKPFLLCRGFYTNLSRNIYVQGLAKGFCFMETHTMSEKRNPFMDDYAKAWERPKTWLFSFIGRPSHPVRGDLCRLFQGNCVNWLVRDSSDYHHWEEFDSTAREKQRRYIEVMAQSKFALCPRGSGSSSIRFYEAMELGVAAVLIGDDVVLPEGPDYKRFMIRVPEQSIANLPAILRDHENRFAEMGRVARSEWERWFAPEQLSRYLLSETEFLRYKTSRTLWHGNIQMGRRDLTQAYYKIKRASYRLLLRLPPSWRHALKRIIGKG